MPSKLICSGRLTALVVVLAVAAFQSLPAPATEVAGGIDLARLAAADGDGADTIGDRATPGLDLPVYTDGRRRGAVQRSQAATPPAAVGFLRIRIRGAPIS